MEDLEPIRNAGAPRRRSSGRRTNLALAVLVPLVVFTGILSFAVGVDLQVDPAAVHAVLALAVALLTPWKSAVVRRGLRRRRPSRFISAALGTLVAVALVSGLVQAGGWTDRVGPLTVMQVHVGAGIGALVMVWLHYRSHPVRFRRIDFDRRSFLRSAGLAGLAALVWSAWESTVRAAGWPGSERRFTGSHERGSHDPRGMPVTSWFNDRTPRIRASEWRLRADGIGLGLSDLDLLPRERVTAILDCTGGWYSEQDWEGVRLDRLVEVGEARSVVIRSETGYQRRFPATDLSGLWLATHLGGAPLSPGHGFPARLVAPGRRGFWWVKWVVEIETSTRPSWIQLPFPPT
ncbi:MAG: molybdopterin-dependent oxidoreductase [Acidimicrobiia bacterium]|nr:molybdopterin-dependent oxidoreductase [Acidimicrobiia bacterium]MXY74016.1 molybdopterin-dependent oxidoreductase [Acidimicrobiia bacterium]MYB78121.1 molybdopterin-dependent oxidoreductase [Acidimicrobiia bacterium]MYG91330.1 molybdopterin-dependent oxidoreductase [Acidimicrobiia bacterium]